MLPAIKSILAGFTHVQPTQSIPTSTPDAVKAQVVKKNKEMIQGKTEAQVNRLTHDLAEAQKAVEQARQTLGERMGDELDTSTALDELTQAESRVKALDAALQVAK